MTDKEDSGTDSKHKLYTRMPLWEFADQYVIEPSDGSSGSSLSVSRKDGSMKLIDEIPQYSSLRVPKIWTIFGVVGMLRLLTGSYLMVITQRESAGSYLGHPIFEISSMKTFPCNHALENTPAEHKKTETEFSGLLNVAERTSGLFFSYATNLTLSVQRLHDLGAESRSVPLWRQEEPRFLWNNSMLEVLIDNKLDPYILPVVQGSFHYFQSAIGKDIIDITLIARRCSRRNGIRMWRRGANSDGNVANFVETEQIMQIKGHTAAFVQVRGSIPLLWQQIVDLTYKPKYELVKAEESPRVMDRHFVDLRKKYGAVLVVDLVNKHGGEGLLNAKFGDTVHSVVSDDVRYFLLNEKGEKMKEQHGVVRTNCVDCLDWTNVTQSMIGRNMLENQLRRLGVFGAEETISSHPNLDDSYKILWADHGDDISVQYSGTPAPKGDFTRFGHRTVQGVLTDGWNALLRYYLNNFCDGTKQDAIDLVQGHYIVSVNRDMAPFSHKGGLEAVASFPLALSLVLIGFLFATMSLRQAVPTVRYDFRHFFFSLIWATISVGLAAFVRAPGRVFCNSLAYSSPSANSILYYSVQLQLLELLYMRYPASATGLTAKVLYPSVFGFQIALTNSILHNVTENLLIIVQ